MNIHQLQIAHDALQDRLLLRVATGADEEYRAWLTRRFLSKLWPHLAKRALPPPAPATAAPAAPGGNFEEPFHDDQATYPLGSKPLLVSEVKFDVRSDGGFDLTLRESRERSFQLDLSSELLQALCAMLRAGAATAKWDLALDYAAAPATPDLTPPTVPPSRLH